MAAIKDHNRLDVLGEHIVDKLHTIIHISVTNTQIGDKTSYKSTHKIIWALS